MAVQKRRAPTEPHKFDLLAYQRPKSTGANLRREVLNQQFANQGFDDPLTNEDRYNRYQSFAGDARDTDYHEEPLVDYLEKAENMMHQANRIKSRADRLRAKKALEALQSNYSAPNVNVNFSNTGSPVAGGKGGFAAFKRAISGQESGGNYGAVNPDSGAMGKYQIIPGNIQGPGGWDAEALGRNVSTNQFLSSPSLQEQIATFKLKQYYNKYGARGAASAWYSGDPNKWRNSSPQGGYPSIRSYVEQILNRMGR